VLLEADYSPSVQTFANAEGGELRKASLYYLKVGRVRPTSVRFEIKKISDEIKFVHAQGTRW